MKWVCPHCKKIIMEDVEEKEVKGNYIQCPYCNWFIINPNPDK